MFSQERSDLTDNDKTAVEGLLKAFPDAAVLSNRFNTDRHSEPENHHLDSLSVKTLRALVEDANLTDPEIVIAKAALTNSYPMGTHLWIRDLSQVGYYLAETRDTSIPQFAGYHEIGVKMLRSAVKLMSTEAQLKRFRVIIESDNQELIDQARHWPQIFLGIENNLSGKEHENWPHKQDAFQIAAYRFLQAVELGWISPDSLSSFEKEFLSLIPPFLAKVQFYNQPNSGSWEELETVRSSVIGWETGLLHNYYKLITTPGMEFLQAGWEKYKDSQFTESEFYRETFEDFLSAMIQRGVVILAENLPFESVSFYDSDGKLCKYSKESLAYREADASLIGLLEIAVPKLIGNVLAWPESKITALESAIFKLVDEKLTEPLTKGIRRYLGDSYQRSGYYLPGIFNRILDVYRKAATASDKGFSSFKERGEILSKGEEAAWTHPVWQLCRWASIRYKETGEEHFRQIANDMLKRGLNFFTCEGDHTLGVKGQIHKINSMQMPEAYVFCPPDGNSSGPPLIMPSENTPLFWSVACVISAIDNAKKTSVLNGELRALGAVTIK